MRRLGRDGHTVGEMAHMLNRPDAEIMDALSTLGLPMPGEFAARRPEPSDDERKALRDRMPTRMQDRMDRIAKGEK